MMADLMHPRSVFREKPNFSLLAEKYPEFKKFCQLNIKNKIVYDFKNREAMKVLSETLLWHYFGIQTCIPVDRLIPTIPLRLNYILWVEDLITLLPENEVALNSNSDQKKQVRGIDIGCGSCAVYMLLGAKIKNWDFLGLCFESDFENVQSSVENIDMNDLSNKIEVEKVENGYALSDVLDPSSSWTFCLTNPPFYDSEDGADRVGKQQPGVSELATPGGETTVIGTLIDHSLVLRSRVQWYTALVGIKKNLSILKQRLSCLEGVKQIETTEFRQGKTWRWGIAWTFCENVSPMRKDLIKQKSPSVANQKKNKPIEYSLALSDLKNCQSLEKDIHKFQKLAAYLKDVLENISESYLETVSEIPCCAKFRFNAKKVTWLHSRRQRRAMNSKTPEKMSICEKFPASLKSPTSSSGFESSSQTVSFLKRNLDWENGLQDVPEEDGDSSLKEPDPKCPKLFDQRFDFNDNEESCHSKTDINGAHFHCCDGFEMDACPRAAQMMGTSIQSGVGTGNGARVEVSEQEMLSADVLNSCIVFKMSKQNFTMTFTSPMPQQRENLNSLMLHLKGLTVKWASQTESHD